MEFSRQEHWSELPFLSPGDLPDPGFEIEFRSSALQADASLSEPPGKPHLHVVFTNAVGESDREGRLLEAEVVGATELKLMSILLVTMQSGLYWLICLFITYEQDREAYSRMRESCEKLVHK